MYCNVMFTFIHHEGSKSTVKNKKQTFIQYIYNNVICIYSTTYVFITKMTTKIRIPQGTNQRVNINIEQHWRQNASLADTTTNRNIMRVTVAPFDTSKCFSIPVNQYFHYACRKTTFDKLFKQFNVIVM